MWEAVNTPQTGLSADQPAGTVSLPAGSNSYSSHGSPSKPSALATIAVAEPCTISNRGMTSSQLPCRVTWLLEFSGAPELEQGWNQYRMTRMYLTTDTAVLTVNAIANAVMLLRLRMLADIPVGGRLCLLINLLLSAAQVLLVRNAAGTYVRYRTLLVCTARLVRVVVVTNMCSIAPIQPSTWLAATLQLILLSPASASFQCAVALPLPLRPHLVLQAVVTAVTLTQVGKVCQQIPPNMQAARCQVLQLLSQRVPWLNPFNMGVLPWAPADGLDCCAPVISAVMVAYGMVFSTIALYTIELVSRTNYLRLASQLPTEAAAGVVRVLRVVWLVSCSIALSVLPIIWEVMMLAQRLGQVGCSGYGLVGLGAVATSLILESFMRAWLALLLLILSSAWLAVWGS